MVKLAAGRGAGGEIQLAPCSLGHMTCGEPTSSQRGAVFRFAQGCRKE